MINIYTNQTEKAVYQIIHDAVHEMGYNIVRIRFLSPVTNAKLQIMIERNSRESVNISDCEKVSRYVSTILDINDETLQMPQYNLELSSCGIDRPLTSIHDVIFYLGKVVRIKTLRKVYESSNFKGILIGLYNQDNVYKKDYFSNNEQNNNNFNEEQFNGIILGIINKNINKKIQNKEVKEIKIDFKDIKDLFLEFE